MLPEFELLTPRTLGEAVGWLAERAPEVVPVAGGTNLVVDMRAGRRRPAVLMDISRLEELRGIRLEGDHVVVGGATTIAELLESPLIAQHAPVLRQAAAWLGNPLIRNRATLAGNLVNASPAADTAPPLLVLDAELELTSRGDRRWLPVQDFFVYVRQTQCCAHELVTAVRWPRLADPRAAAFSKLALRKCDAVAVVNAAVRLELDADRRCRLARIAVGAVAPTPTRVRRAEEHLLGQPVTPELINQVAQLVAEECQPISDIRGSAAYRRRVAAVLVRRLLLRLAGGAQQEEV